MHVHNKLVDPMLTVKDYMDWTHQTGRLEKQQKNQNDISVNVWKLASGTTAVLKGHTV